VARMTGWQAVVAALRAEQVPRVYGLPGDPRQLYEALYDAPEIQAVLVRHEASGVFMAMAESRVLGTVGICHASPGPGMTNTVSGLLEAYSACQPIVCVATGTPGAYIGMGAFQEHDGVGAARPVTKWSTRVERPERIPWTMQRAFAVARSGKPGPVYVEVPSDVGLAEAEMEEYHRIPGPLRSAPDPSDVREAADLLQGSARPVLVAGGGVVASAAATALVGLAEQEHIPVMTTLSGRGSIAEDHDLAFGLAGLYRTRPGRDVFNAADVLVTVGARMEGFQSGDWKIYPRNARFVQIDLDPFEIGRNWVPDVALAGDARLALEALAGALAHAPGNREERCRTTGAAVAAKAAFAEEVDRECEAATAVPLQSKRIVHELNDVFGRDTILVNENGGQDLWSYFHPYYRVLDVGDVVVPGEQTCMGAGVTGAVGAKLARPDKKVVCVTGDGAFQMMPQELSTAVQYGAPVTWLVLNTRSLGWSQWRQRDSGRYIATDFESQPDFAALARAHGCHGERVSDPAGVRPALERALDCTSAGTPTVVDFAVAAFDYYPGFVSFPEPTWQDDISARAPAPNLP
jgi:acetolactate synthase I/II/III large subunit